MLSLASQRRSIQNNNPATRPSRLMSITLCRDGCGWRTCLRHVLPRVRRAETRPPSLGCRGPLHDTNSCCNHKPAPRGIGGRARREASIEAVRFRCKLQGASRLYLLLVHRNLRHAGRRLKRAFRFRKFFGYFLPKKVTTRKHHAQTMHSECVTAWAVTP
jgi:hypothetical protein